MLEERRQRAPRMLAQPAQPCSSFLQCYLCTSQESQIPRRSYPKPAWKQHVLPPGTIVVQCEPWLSATWAARPCSRAPVLIHLSPPAPCLLQLCPASTAMLTFTKVFLDHLLRAAGCPPARAPQHAGQWLRFTAGKPRCTQTFSKYALTRRNTIHGSPRSQEPAMRPAPNLGAMNSL